MPYKNLKACAMPGCPALVRDGRYCPDHEGRVERAYDRGRGSSAQRGYGSRWRRLRAMYLHEHPVCADPFGVHGSQVVMATEVDHQVPRFRGGEDTEENLQALCKACHSRKTALKDGRWG
jgi:5-methylcytosine-specific restriction protein A